MRLLHCKWAPWKLSGYLSDCIIPTWAKCQPSGRARRFCSGNCNQSVTALIRLRYRLYFRQITWSDGEKRNPDCVAFAWKSIYSVSSAVITIHLEKNAFKSLSVSEWETQEYRCPPLPVGFPWGGFHNIAEHMEKVSARLKTTKSLDSDSNPR